MRAIIFLAITFLFCSPLFTQTATRNKYHVKKRPADYSEETQIAKDLELAYRDIRSFKGRDHYIRLISTGVRQTKTLYGVEELVRRGGMLTIKLVGLEDDDDWYAVTVRAKNVQGFQLLVNPYE